MTRTDRVRHQIAKMRTSSNHMINGTTNVTSVRVGGSQQTDCNKQIIVAGTITKLMDIDDGSSDKIGVTWNVFALNGTNRICKRAWSLMTRVSKLFGCLQRGHPTIPKLVAAVAM